MERVQTFGRKKTAVAVAIVKQGTGQFRINGMPLDSITPDILRIKGIWIKTVSVCNSKKEIL